MGYDVALLAEGVDRNDLDLQVDACEKVALLAEGVDRNVRQVKLLQLGKRRPPRGGRG